MTAIEVCPYEVLSIVSNTLRKNNTNVSVSLATVVSVNDDVKRILSCD